jgi:hypothetical protein
VLLEWVDPIMPSASDSITLTDTPTAEVEAGVAALEVRIIPGGLQVEIA